MSNFETRALALTMAVEHSERGVPVETVINTAVQFHDYLSGSLTPNPAQTRTQAYTTIQIMELLICQSDPVKFAENIALPSPDGTMTGCLYAQQLQYIRELNENVNTVCLSSRQVGASLCLTIFVLWTALYKPDQTIVVIAPTYRHSLEIMERIRSMYDSLPYHLKIATAKCTKGEVHFENGSRIVASGSSGNHNFRGLSISLIAIDTAAWISHGASEELMTTLRSQIASGSRAIIQSSAGEAKGLFYDVWIASLPKDARTGFTPFFLDWRDYPGRDAAWEKRMKDQIGEKAFRQDYDGEFIEPRNGLTR